MMGKLTASATAGNQRSRLRRDHKDTGDVKNGRRTHQELI
jgi:hypothetical protein